MANGLLTPINTKDNFYKMLMLTDTDNVELFINIKRGIQIISRNTQERDYGS